MVYGVRCRMTFAEVGNRRKAGVQVAVAKARGETLAVVQSLELPERAGSVFNTAGSSFARARAPQGNWEISNQEGRLPALRAMVNSVCNKGFE